MTIASAHKAVEATLESIRKRTPAYVELADKFGPVFLSSAKQRDEFAKDGIRVPLMDESRIAAGVPILVGADLSPWTEEFVQSAEAMMPELFEVLALEEDAQHPLRDLLSSAETLLGLVQARIEGDWNHFENASVITDTMTPTTLMYISEIVSTPVLSAIVEALGKPLTSLTWENGHCPVCGSSPSISFLSPKEVTDLDQLVGGGGKKYLHCSLCGHDWRFKRNMCSACGNDDSETREIFTEDDSKFERIEACHKCGKYCLNVDMREYEPQPHLDTVQMGLIHLDIFARNNKLLPITATLWNSLD